LSPALDPPDQANQEQNLERWCAFHEQVEALPAAEREVVSLLFYHGWTKAEIARLFEERYDGWTCTSRLRWHNADSTS
jgi:DNA-directed RNA polymerase specialized sigma24 family protein